MKNKWIEFLGASGMEDSFDPNAYSYPISDSRTDKNLEEQHPGTRERERNLYSEWLSEDWETACDFGCGTGANFECFDRPHHDPRWVLGIEPDAKRAERAKANAKAAQCIRIEVVCGDISLLERAPEHLTFDKILCSQVLGHVPCGEAARIVEGFAGRLRPGGSCAISIPVIGYADSDSSSGTTDRGDFTHLVNLDCSHQSDDYRRPVPEDVFERYARSPEPNLLPVRSFYTPGIFSVKSTELPCTIDTFPSTLHPIVEHHFEISSVVLYSIHDRLRRENGVDCVIGDLLITLKKRRA